jgi:hypothetical protein
MGGRAPLPIRYEVLEDKGEVFVEIVGIPFHGDTESLAGIGHDEERAAYEQGCLFFGGGG